MVNEGIRIFANCQAYSNRRGEGEYLSRKQLGNDQF